MVRVLTLQNGKKTEIALRSVNFSIKRVAADLTYEVPEDHQMLLSGAFVNLGHFINNGETVLIDLEDQDTDAPPFPELPPDNFSHVHVATNQTKTIPSGQQMNCIGTIVNLGQLVVLGELTLSQLYQEDPLEPPIELPDDNFSIKSIGTGETKTIPANQQMILCGSVFNSGTFKNFGELILIDAGNEEEHDYLPPYEIIPGEVFTVKANRLFFLPIHLVNNGQFINNGRVYLGE
jgi:hypothetical protein